MDELKSRCLGQLEIISKKRLLSIIEGQEMDSSSSESGNGAANMFLQIMFLQIMFLQIMFLQWILFKKVLLWKQVKQ